MTPTLTTSAPFFESLPASPAVFVIESDTWLRWALDTLAHEGRWQTEAVASISALLGRRRTFAPSCLVLDVWQLDFDDPPLHQWRIDMPVICIVDAGNVSLCVHVMKAGAVDVLAKPVGTAPLLEAVRLALNRSEEALRREVELNEVRERYASLSPREREVMALVVSGLLNKRVAHEMGISEVTVKAHRGRVMGKMNAQSLADLVKMAIMLELTQCQLALSARHELPSERHTEEAPVRHVAPVAEYIGTAPDELKVLRGA